MDQLFEMTEQTVLPYAMPITRIIEDNSVKDLDVVEMLCDATVDEIQRLEDQRFLREIADGNFDVPSRWECLKMDLQDMWAWVKRKWRKLWSRRRI